MAKTIALVDDDRNILTSVSIALEAEGFAARTADVEIKDQESQEVVVKIQLLVGKLFVQQALVEAECQGGSRGTAQWYRQLVAEFCQLAYGPASKTMLCYYKLLEETAASGTYYTSSDVVGTFGPKVVDQTNRLMAQAVQQVEAAVEDGADPNLLKRMQYVARAQRVVSLHLQARHATNRFFKSRNSPALRVLDVKRLSAFSKGSSDLTSTLKFPMNYSRFFLKVLIKVCMSRFYAVSRVLGNREPYSLRYCDPLVKSRFAQK